MILHLKKHTFSGSQKRWFFTKNALELGSRTKYIAVKSSLRTFDLFLPFFFSEKHAFKNLKKKNKKVEHKIHQNHFFRKFIFFEKNEKWKFFLKKMRFYSAWNTRKKKKLFFLKKTKKKKKFQTMAKKRPISDYVLEHQKKKG